MKVTALLAAVIIVFFAGELVSEPLVEQGVFVPARAFSAPWTWVSSLFLHADPLHIFFNLFALLAFGPTLEGALGPRRYLGVYFLAGLAGNLGYMFTADSPTTPALGASGAIYGILGCLAVLMPRLRVYLLFLPIPVPLIVAAFFWGALEYFGLFAPGTIAHGAHLGGLFVGATYGLALRSGQRRQGNLFDYG